MYKFVSTHVETPLQPCLQPPWYTDHRLGAFDRGLADVYWRYDRIYFVSVFDDSEHEKYKQTISLENVESVERSCLATPNKWLACDVQHKHIRPLHGLTAKLAQPRKYTLSIRLGQAKKSTGGARPNWSKVTFTAQNFKCLSSPNKFVSNSYSPESRKHIFCDRAFAVKAKS